MIELVYKLYGDAPYLTDIIKGDSDSVKFRIEGVERGFIRVGDIPVRLDEGYASIPLEKIAYGTTRVELITPSHQYKLLPIERNISGVFPVIDREELTSIFNHLYKIEKELDEIKGTTLALSEAVFKTTIL